MSLDLSGAFLHFKQVDADSLFLFITFGNLLPLPVGNKSRKKFSNPHRFALDSIKHPNQPIKDKRTRRYSILSLKQS